MENKSKLFTIASKPFLKWAGGKHKLVNVLMEKLGHGTRLVEPFVGSGAVFMGVNFEKYLLCDSNNDLIPLFNNLKNNPEELLREVKDLFTPAANTEESFYTIRDEFNKAEQGCLRRNAIFVYLNKHAFNGLCRYNSKGKFNVPYGRYTAPKPPIAEMLLFSEKSQLAEFECLGFEEAFNRLEQGDVIYCDPPYVPLSATSSFTSYHTNGFNPFDQKLLALKAMEARGKGLRVVMSNHDTEFTREIYSEAEIFSLDVRRSISSKSSTRGNAKEIIAVF